MGNWFRRRPVYRSRGSTRLGDRDHQLANRSYDWVGLRDDTAFYLDILAAISTIAIFAIVVYVETTRIEIPLAHSSVRGARGRFHVKLVYASVLPLILVRALQANIQMIGILLYNAGFTWVGTYTGNTPTSGLMYYLAPINGPQNWFPGLTTNPGWQVA